MTVKVAVIGLDALGQSLCLALQQSRHDLEVVAHDRDRLLRDAAQEASVAHRVEGNLIRAVEGASLIIVNEALHELRDTFEVLAREVENEAVVTDTVPYKAVVVGWVDELFPDHLFYVGSTPLVTAGEEPDATLFDGHQYALVPLPQSPERAVRLLTDALAAMGAEPFFIDLDEHDALMAAVVQLPATMGAALINLVAQSQAWRELVTLADTPYHSVATLPFYSAEAMSALLIRSRAPLLRWLEALQEELDGLRSMLEAGDEAALTTHLTALMASQRRWKKGELSSNEENLARAIDDAQSRRGLLGFFGVGRRGD